jgi:hypothetical protein
VLGKLSRFFLIPQQTFNRLPVSLPPYEAEFCFPIYLRTNEFVLVPDIRPLLPGVKFEILAVKYRLLQVTDNNASFLLNSRK